MSNITVENLGPSTHKVVDMDGETFYKGSFAYCKGKVDEWEDADPRTVAGGGIRVVAESARWVRPSMSFGGTWKV